MKASIASVCLAFAMVQVVIAGRGVVLCLEPGGDVKVESAASGGCAECPADGSSAPDDTSARPEGAACACVDVALDAWTAMIRIEDLAAQLLLAPPMAAVEPPSPPCLSTGVTSAWPPVAAALTAHSLVGTTVLRI